MVLMNQRRAARSLTQLRAPGCLLQAAGEMWGLQLLTERMWAADFQHPGVGGGGEEDTARLTMWGGSLRTGDPGHTDHSGFWRTGVLCKYRTTTYG